MVKKQRKMKIKRDEAWMSEQEMRSELGWSAISTQNLAGARVHGGGGGVGGVATL